MNRNRLDPDRTYSVDDAQTTYNMKHQKIVREQMGYTDNFKEVHIEEIKDEIIMRACSPSFAAKDGYNFVV